MTLSTAFPVYGQAAQNSAQGDVDIFVTKIDPAGSVYPDSNKVGFWPPGKLFRLDDAVDYFEGEK